jgi:hypothetical protein
MSTGMPDTIATLKRGERFTVPVVREGRDG